MSRRSRAKRATHRRPPETRAAPPTAAELSAAIDENEQSMGDGAAYHLACEQLGIDPDEGYGILAADGDHRDG